MYTVSAKCNEYKSDTVFLYKILSDIQIEIKK